MNSAAPKPHLVVRQEERGAWRALMQQHHYPGFEHPIGESLCYVASRGGDWVALLGWGSAALKCGVRHLGHLHSCASPAPATSLRRSATAPAPIPWPSRLIGLPL